MSRQVQVVPEGYRPLTVEGVPAYVRSRPELSALVPDDPLTVREVGDGNLNLVFIVRSDPAVPGVVLKQSLPWVRVFGEGWPLTIERARHEADAYEVHQRFAGAAIPLRAR
jgi:5-methylthioribose kinase